MMAISMCWSTTLQTILSCSEMTEATETPGWLSSCRAIPNNPAIGAVIEVWVAGRMRIFQSLGGTSYMAANDPRIHVGLGAAEVLDEAGGSLAARRCRSHQEAATAEDSGCPRDEGLLRQRQIR